MKLRFGIILIFAVILFFVLSVISWSQKFQEKASIEYENGTKIIRNPSEAMYGEIKFELKQDLNIGKKNDENYIFNRIRGIAVDDCGNIYVADMGNQRIQKFDRGGKFLMTIGKGRGTDRFKQPTKILINETKGNIYVRDQTIIKAFDRAGEYIAEVLPKKFPLDFIIDRNGTIYAKLSSNTESGDYTRDFSKIDSNGEIVKTYTSFPYNLVLYSKMGGEGYTGFEYDLFIANIDDETFLYGFSKEYVLNVIDREGNLFFKIKKDELYNEFPSNDRRRYSKLMAGIIFNPPSYIPFFYSLLVDSEKRIYVQTNNIKHKPEVDREVDVFSKDGYYLYRTKLPHYTEIIKNGYLYTHVINKAEEVKRYKIKNWEKIKAGISD